MCKRKRAFGIELPRRLNGKESTCECRRHRFDLWVGRFPRRRKWQPAPGFLPGEFHGQSRLAGSRVGCKELDRTERTGMPLDSLTLKIPLHYSYQSLPPYFSKYTQAKPRMLQNEKQMVNQHRQRSLHLYTAVCVHVHLFTSNSAISRLQSSLEII